MMAVAGLVFSAATGGKVSSVLLVAIPVLLIALTVIIILASRYSISLRKKLDQINRLFLESLEGVRVIRAFNKQKTESERFEEANADYAMTAMTAGRITSLLMPAISVIFGVTTAAVLGMGAYYVDAGAMEVGSLVANSQYISMVLTSVMMLSLVIMMFPTSYACAKRIAEVLETESSICDGDFAMENRPLHATVEFRHVTFAYPGADEPILKDVSFVSNPGEVTAIIGGTGRGKSSILKLIPRLYDPMFGEVVSHGGFTIDHRICTTKKTYSFPAISERILILEKKTVQKKIGRKRQELPVQMNLSVRNNKGIMTQLRKEERICPVDSVSVWQLQEP